MRRTFRGELRHKNKSEVMCMCPINSAVVRAFRPEPRPKIGEVFAIEAARLIKSKNPHRMVEVKNRKVAM